MIYMNIFYFRFSLPNSDQAVLGGGCQQCQAGLSSRLKVAGGASQKEGGRDTTRKSGME